MITCVVRQPGGWQRGARALAWGMLLLVTAGCSRAFYRRQADREVSALVDSAAEKVGWSAGEFTIRPSPESRMFDPTCPDYPPMPPDDPTAHRLMRRVDYRRGWPWERRYGSTPSVENPDWTAYLPYDERREVALDRDTAVEVALLHSREYQGELENLYLSALDVTLERFRFDAQFFGGNSTFFTSDGSERGGQNVLNTDTDLQMRRLLAGGGELVVGMANSLVWQFAGPDTYNANTLLDLSLVQPLLRGAGRAVVMEKLTASERALLADIRQLERFRREFYVQVVVDYLGLLEEQVLIRNQQANVASLRSSLERLESIYEGGGIKRGDVDRTRQSLYDAQSRLLALNAGYENRLDAHKITLGLPPELDIRIADPLLTRFDLIDPRLTATQETVAQLLDQLRVLKKEGHLARKEEYVGTMVSIEGDVTVQLEIVAADMQLLDRALPERRESLRRLSSREEFRRGDIDPRIGNVEDLDRRVRDLQSEFAAISQKLESTLLELQSYREGAAGNAAEVAAPTETFEQRVLDLVDLLSNQLLELSLIQARARLDTVTLTPFEVAPQEALEIARAHRRDWMNARAALVDNWRQIEVTANELESGLDVTFSGDLNTTEDNPVRFRSTTGRLRVGLEFDAPLTRLAERNAYRRALINYQQARREYYAFEDRLSQSLRSRLRVTRLNQMDFEVQRAAVFVAISRVDETRLRLRQPPKQGGTMQVGESFVERLVSDLSALLGAQNRFLSVWVNQEIQRLNLDLDFGTMRLDTRGMWIDPGPMATTDGEEDGRTEAPAWTSQPLEEIPLPPGEAEGPVPP